MRWPIFAVVAIASVAGGVANAGKIRLAQTSNTTNCMMTCNSQAATCQSSCFLPPALSAPGSTPTPGPNVTANTTCVMNCTTTQVTCQASCARTSPSP
jgi:hypothetical protein